MPITYYKRFRMEIDLDGAITGGSLPRRYVWVPWDESLFEQHAEGEIPELCRRSRCVRVPLPGRPGRMPPIDVRNPSQTRVSAGRTWLVACEEGYVGAVQGVMDRGPIGAIQNVGVLPEFRGQGLGKALVRRALAGFFQAGLQRAYLEVTAQNDGAVQLYRERRDFRRAKTLYKAVDD